MLAAELLARCRATPLSDQRIPVRRALISVSDKSGIVELAQALAAAGAELVSTGGTARVLRDAGLEVRDVAELTGLPEMMDGRVKTLHPAVHGALLGRSGVDDAVMAEHGIVHIDLLVVNLYPFEATVARTDCRFDDAIEQIDIGGPAMLRAAAKNHARVAVLVEPAQYPAMQEAIVAGGSDARLRREWAAQAFAHTAAYDGQVAEWLSRRVDDPQHATDWPRTLHPAYRLAAPLRYGENPHQTAALYLDARSEGAGTVARARMLQGREMSYNNLADADAALECVRGFQAPACVIVKHANPCGVAVAASIGAAYDLAYATDAVSAFGGIIAFNRALDEATARVLVARQFVEVVIAPGYAPEALAALSKKPNVRVLDCGPPHHAADRFDSKRIAGALLVQTVDRDALQAQDCRIVSRCQPDDNQCADLLFAWRVAMHVKSNAIVYARDQRTVGIGAGQMSRVVSARIAAIKAGEAGLEVRGSVMASDAFFPFRDGIDAAAAAGIVAVIQPGGSMRDAEVIAAADEHGMAMLFTGVRHFRH